jgi:glycosyltransferase involved in cell wall biosynthesis
MNILFLNNYHYLRGGSERVFFDEIQLLGSHGHNTTSFARNHAENITSEYEPFFPEDIKTDSIHFSWKALKTLKEIMYSAKAKDSLHELLKRFPAEIAHAHNIYGRLTSSVLDLLSRMDIPIVMTIHDYKLICPNYRMVNNGQICEACMGKHFYKSLIKKCHKSSILASTVYALESYFCHRLGKYTNNINILIAPSHFIKNKFIQFGWSEERVVYLPNFIASSAFDPDYNPGKYFLYLGRLSSEKGILTMINSFMMLEDLDARLLIAGQGPSRTILKEKADEDSRIRFVGHLSGNELKDIIKKSIAVIVPSEWYENAPITILESFAYGKPVVGSRIGGIPEMISDGVDGYLFEPGNADGLREKLELMLNMTDARIIEMGKAARQKVERLYNPEIHYEGLMKIYHKALRRI